MPVVVTGQPSLALETGSVDLFPGFFVEVAPLPSSTKAVAFPNTGINLQEVLPPGFQCLIDNQLYTVDSVNGNTVIFLEDYAGTVVDPTLGVAQPQISVFSPGFREARYSRGSGSNRLVFTYTVQFGDTALDLEYTGTSALQLNAGSIKRLSTTPFTDADLTLAAPGSPTSLGSTANLVVDTSAPLVTQLNLLTRDGVYRAGDEILIEVVFDLPVVVGASARASLRTNVDSPAAPVGTAPDRLAVYLRGSGPRRSCSGSCATPATLLPYSMSRTRRRCIRRTAAVFRAFGGDRRRRLSLRCLTSQLQASIRRESRLINHALSCRISRPQRSPRALHSSSLAPGRTLILLSCTPRR
ncbi:hypothetical protein PINS_up014702 [Pythium insidiosum]|nr:hypothetical protein PINS_up014702 [Pythium insidiosum]